MSRPTPETDAEHRDITQSLGATHLGFVGLGFARDLERQRDEAWELARELLYELKWKGKMVGLTLAQQALIAKAKEVLP